MEHILEVDVQEMRRVLEPVFGQQVHQWRITYATYEAFGALVLKSAESGKAMHMMPRPYELSSHVKWAKRQVRHAMARYFLTDEGRHYLIGMRPAGKTLQAAFEAARYAAY